MTQFPEKLAAIENKLFINGEFVESKGGKPFEVVDPSTEKIIGTASAASQADVDLSVEAARKALETSWENTDAHEKGRILYRVADLIEKNAEWLAYY